MRGFDNREASERLEMMRLRDGKSTFGDVNAHDAERRDYGLVSAMDILRQRKPAFKVFTLTGAGISLESGMAKFRDAGGIWGRYPVKSGHP